MFDYPYNLGMVFDRVARANWHRPALRYPSGDVSFGQLSALADAVAKKLVERGVRPGNVVAIANTKRPASYACMIAALRTGVAYVNVDVASPPFRTEKVLEVSRARLLLVDDPTLERQLRPLERVGICDLVVLDGSPASEAAAAPSASEREPSLHVDGASIAYIMFTSGSTGVPKGVAVTHQNVLHLISWGQGQFGICPEDNFANLSPMYFDNSVFDFFVGLFSGAALSPVPRELMNSPYELVEYVARMGCTTWFSVPSLLMYLTTMKALRPGTLPEVRRFIFGGEGYPKPELKKLFDTFSGQARLVNVYGPTECTCICSAYGITERDFVDPRGLPPLGRLNQNFDFRIVDEEGRDATTGELHLIGPNVAAGYFNDAARTAASFAAVTDDRRFMKPAYRTGDIVKLVGDELHFVGRKDNQIKHMGYRIELEEIEQALVRLPTVDQAAVVYHRTNTAYGKIVGFAAMSAPADERDLIRQLAEILPAYMIPSRLVLRSQLPKNPNGKVDRRLLLELVQNLDVEHQ